MCYSNSNSQRRHQRRRTALLIVLAGTAAFSLQNLLTSRNHNTWETVDDVGVVANVGGSDSAGDNIQQLSLTSTYEEEMDMEMEEQQQEFLHRILTPIVEEAFGKEDDEILAIPSDEDIMLRNNNSNENIEAPVVVEPASNDAQSVTPYAKRIDANESLPPYTIVDAIESSKMYDHNFALLVYDPEDDVFYGMYSKRHYWMPSCKKLLNSIKYLAYFLRKIFPARFRGKSSDELIIPISSGDYPGVQNICIDYFRRHRLSAHYKKVAQRLCSHQSTIAPILHFGSVFRHDSMFPNMVAMPMPVPHHLYCFEMWATHGVVCKELREKGESKRAELVFGDGLGLKWEDLIPQVVWRGTDFCFLAKIHPELEKARFKEKLINWPWTQTKRDKRRKKIGGLTATDAALLKQKLDRVRKRAPHKTKALDYKGQILTRFAKAAAVESLKEHGTYANLLPRWKAAVLTAEAEVDYANQQDQNQPDALPWADMKFSTYINGGHKKGARGADEYKDLEDIGLDVTGRYKSHEALAHYRYQIDLGGGGGTTWTGTIEKLAMPGLLFHHLTPTKDYIYDWMEPWVHYVPVSLDLLDLKGKFDWAESHPVEAKKIADEGTKLMRYLTSPEGYEQMYQRDIVAPLRQVIEAYQPISIDQSQTSWRTWREAMGNIEGDDVLLSVIQCSGSSPHSCGGSGVVAGGSKVLEKKYTRKASRQYPK